MNIKKTAVAMAVALSFSAAAAIPETLATLDMGDGTAGIAVDPVSRKVYVTNYTSGTMSIVGVDDASVEVALPVGPNPRRIVFDAHRQRAYIVNDLSLGTVTVVDTKDNKVVATISVGKRPRNIAADFQAKEVYVANLDSNSLSVIDTDTDTVKATVPVGSAPSMGEIDRRLGRVYVVSQLDRALHVIDQKSKEVLRVVTTGRAPGNATVDELTGKVYVNNVRDNTIDVVDPDTISVIKTLESGPGSTFGATSAVYRRYYLPNAIDHSVTVVDTDTDEVLQKVPVGASPQQVVLNSSDGDIYVVNRGDHTVTTIDARTEQVTGNFAVGTNPWRIATGMNRVFTLNENGSRQDSLTISTEKNTVADTAIVTEYYHKAFDHFFNSANGPETRLLADGIFGEDWDRTLTFFRVWNKEGPSRVPVCRFYSETFAPKSSHFYTPVAAECESLKAGTAWKFEEVSYYVELPDAEGSCRTGTSPIYRLYNDGMSGAPNHRLTGDKDARDALVAKGWTPEGSGPDAVVACGPTLRGDEL